MAKKIKTPVVKRVRIKFEMEVDIVDVGDDNKAWPWINTLFQYIDRYKSHNPVLQVVKVSFSDEQTLFPAQE